MISSSPCCCFGYAPTPTSPEIGAVNGESRYDARILCSADDQNSQLEIYGIGSSARLDILDLG